VRIADALSVTALVLTLSILLFGGMATWVGPIRVSARSPFRALLVALAIIIFRHAAYRADPLHARIRRGLAAAAERPAWGAVAIALTSRVAVIAVALFAVLTIGPLTGAIGFAVSDDPLENLQARFDAGWYGGIAQDGYAFDGDYDRQQNIAFFPAFPMAMRAAGAVVGGFNPHRDRWWRKTRLLWAGATVSMLAFAGGCLYLLRIARISGLEARGLDAVALMAAYPFAAYYSAAYTEGLFLLASAGAFYHFATRQWSRAFAWGLVVGLTRPNGCFLSVALAVMAAEEAWRARRAAGGEAYPWLPAVLAASGAGLGLIAYSVFVGRPTGSPGRTSSAPGADRSSACRRSPVASAGWTATGCSACFPTSRSTR
jgi:hypothetical protein